jgi:FAD/FMN-containing dehydrogenase
MLVSEEQPIDVSALRARLDGDVSVPGDPDWDEARLAWNLAADQRPAAVVQAESAADVLAVVEFARANGVRIAPQGTGHMAGALESLDGTLLLKTSRMRGVEIDPEARRARVEADVIWQEVADAAAEHGLAALAGSAWDVGVVGYSLGGGMGWMARRYGLAANSVTALELVTADGGLVRADRDNVHETLVPWEADRTYFNFTERRADGRTLFGELTHRRLRDVKARYDAGELFRPTHPIRPAE